MHKVYIEQPIELGFANATCILPEYYWQEINGFTQEQINSFQQLIEKKIPLHVLNDILSLIELCADFICEKWNEHFNGIRYYC